MPENKILVANDEEDILRIVIDRLEFYGFSVRTATDNAQCMESIDREVPDLLLLDVRMPDGNGMDLLAQLRDKYPELTVLMLSASADRDVIEKSLSMGAAGYIITPFTSQEFKQKVFHALGKESA